MRDRKGTKIFSRMKYYDTLVHTLVLLAHLVQHCINNRVICTCLLRQYCVVVSHRSHRYASFLRLVLTQNSGTYYFVINATLY